MLSVGVRELKQQASELIRRVREEGDEVQVTYRGEVVAMLVPVNKKRNEEVVSAAWTDIDQLAAQIGAKWQGTPSAIDAVQEGRR